VFKFIDNFINKSFSEDSIVPYVFTLAVVLFVVTIVPGFVVYCVCINNIGCRDNKDHNGHMSTDAMQRNIDQLKREIVILKQDLNKALKGD
jgi:hypothetical protein